MGFGISSNIVTTFNPAIGELVLTGKDSKSNYEMAISKVSFSSPVSGVAGDKKISITVNDSTSNSNAVSRIVRILEIFPEVDIVNSFTPNDDGVNDYWDFTNLEYYSKISISIFDRNGIKVFSCLEQGCTWDGKLNGKELPVGPYFYTIDLNDRKRKYQGTVTILR
jgi:gliding motility-associated-like protein